MEFEIIKIIGKGNIALSCEGKPINPEKPIWKKELDNSKKNSVMHPTAFLTGSSIPVGLKITSYLPNSKSGEKYVLEGKDERNNILFSGSIKLDADNDEIEIEAFSKFKQDKFIRINGEQLFWTVTKKGRKRKKIVSNQIKVPLELYWLFGTDNQLFKKGIPVEILRSSAYNSINIEETHYSTVKKILKTIREVLGLEPPKIDQKTKETLIKEIAEYCFTISPPRYDTCKKKVDRIIQGHLDSITFLSKEYLRAIQNPEALCDCFEQAAVLQLFLRAFGIREVWLAYIRPFGFINATNLVGRGGPCNNPFFCEDDTRRLVKPADEKRTQFNGHAFCKLKGYNWIVDACIGPHTGGEDAKTYLNNAIDRSIDKLSDLIVDENDIKLRYGIKTVDWLNNLKDESDILELSELIHKVRIPGKETLSITEKYVVCKWSNPISFLNSDDWSVYEDVVPGMGEVMKTWTLKRKQRSKGTIKINLYVSSSGFETTMNRFLSYNTLSSHPESLYKEGPSYLGMNSKMYKNGRSHQYFWVSHNVLFDVSFQNVDIDIEQFLMRLQSQTIAPRNIKKDISGYLPPFESVSCSNKKPEVGEIIEIGMKTPKDVFSDFNIDAGNGLFLSDEENGTLFFAAQKISNNKLILAAVDEKTFLVRNEEIDINIRNKEQ